MTRSWFARYFLPLLYAIFPFRPSSFYLRPLKPTPLPPTDDAITDSTEFTTDRSNYRMGRTLGAGTYGIVREADCNQGKVAVKIILKKNVKGNEQMVYDELSMLQKMQHPHIVKFVDWFESRVSGPPVGAWQDPTA